MSRSAQFSINTFADVDALLAQMPGPDEAAAEVVRQREPTLTKPPGALGRLERLTEWLAQWQGRELPALHAPACHIFAGNHGVAALGVSAFPSEVTAQMVANFRAGGAAVNQLCKSFGIRLSVTAMDLDRPTADFTKAPALTEADAVAALQTGLNSDLAGVDCLCVGEMGIGNTTAASALCLALYGGAVEAWTGAGTGVSGAAWQIKCDTVRDGVALHGPEISAAAPGRQGLEALRRLGGRELLAIAGAIVKARLTRVPVILDGFITLAAAACLTTGRPGALDHCVLSHQSREPGHGRLAVELGLDPLLNMDMALGEGSGACLAVPILQAATQCHMGMHSFDQAGVSGAD